MYSRHPLLYEPDRELVIWHYFSLSKFLGLLDSSMLYFRRDDCYEDGYEGHLSLRDKAFLNSQHPGLAEDVEKHDGLFFYSSCWTMSDVEEYVLWNTYSSLVDGIAIQTTVGSLIESLDPNDSMEIHISNVQYIDYYEDFTFAKTAGRAIILAPHFSKRPYFKSENELRLLHCMTDHEIKDAPKGLNVRVDLNKLIQKVYVSPSSYDWFKGSISRLLEKYGLHNITVEKSDI